MKLDGQRFCSLSVLLFTICFSLGVSVANAQITLEPPIIVEGGDGMLQSVAIDVNGDNLPDLITNGKKTDTINVQINQGGGQFGKVVEYPVGQFITLPDDLPAAEPLSIAAADFNGDGKPDIVSANSQAESVTVRLNLGDGTFGGAVDYAIRPDGYLPAVPGFARYEPSDIKIADVNNDGIADLVTANIRGGTVSVLLGNGSLGIGNGSFRPAVFYRTGGQPSSLALDDFDGDGLIDMVVANKSPTAIPYYPGSPILMTKYYIHIFMNIGSGAFGVPQRIFVGVNPLHVITAKMDNDLCPDILTANHSSQLTLSLLYNNCDGTGTFSDHLELPSLYPINAISAADLDGDGDLDLSLAGHFTPGALVILTNNTDPITGATSFSAPESHLLGGLFNAATDVITEDLDFDGDIDVLLLSKFSDNFSLLLNTKVANVPSLPPVVPGGPVVVAGPPDLTVTINKFDARVKDGMSQVSVELSVSNVGNEVASGIIVVMMDIAGDPTSYPMFVSTAGIAPGDTLKGKFKKELPGDYSRRAIVVNVLPARGPEGSGLNTVIIEENLGNNQDGTILP